MDDYIEQVVNLCSDSYYPERVGANLLIAGLDAFSQDAFGLDVVKKVIFYGQMEHKLLGHDEKTDMTEKLRSKGVDSTRMLSLFDPLILHGILGVATEAGEMIDAMLNTNSDTPFDLVNLQEEIGDVMWYLALLCSRLGVTFEQIQEQNIAKLRKRYPEKFTEYDAINRDLKAERETLEGQHEHLR